jgi:hypothetical protein
MNASYSPSANWILELSCLVSANEIPAIIPGNQDAESPTYVRELGPALTSDVQYAEPFDLNGGRLPGFQRLEFRVVRLFELWGSRVQATARLLNGYGLADPFVWEIRQSPDPRLKWAVKVDAPPLFPLYPVFSIGVRF